MRAFTVDFAVFHKENAPDLYPVTLRKQIDEANEYIGVELNKAMYRIGYRKTQPEYDDAVNVFFSMLADLNQRFLSIAFTMGIS